MQIVPYQNKYLSYFFSQFTPSFSGDQRIEYICRCIESEDKEFLQKAMAIPCKQLLLSKASEVV